MSTQQVMLAESNFLLDSAQFDGTNDAMTRGADLTGISDGKTGTFSVWIRLDGGNGSIMDLFVNATSVGGLAAKFLISRNTSNLFEVIGVNAAGSTVLDMRSVATYTAGATWLNLLMSWDLGASASNLYVNDVSDKTTVGIVNDNISYVQADYAVGARASLAEKLNGCLAELYFTNTYLDFSVTANRRKFITAAGKPANLGPTGLLPTGTVPLVYFHLNKGETANDFAINRGSGGNFTVTGALTTGSTSPS